MTEIIKYKILSTYISNKFIISRNVFYIYLSLDILEMRIRRKSKLVMNQVLSSTGLMVYR